MFWGKRSPHIRVPRLLFAYGMLEQVSSGISPSRLFTFLPDALDNVNSTKHIPPLHVQYETLIGKNWWLLGHLCTWLRSFKPNLLRKIYTIYFNVKDISYFVKCYLAKKAYFRIKEVRSNIGGWDGFCFTALYGLINATCPSAWAMFAYHHLSHDGNNA